MNCKNYFNLFVLFTFFSCSSGGTLNVKTIPSEASVKLIEMDGEIRELGKSPVTIPINTIFPKSKFIQLIIEGKEHLPERVVLTKPLVETDINLSLDLKKKNVVVNSDKALEKATVKVAEAYREITKGEYREAERLLITLRDEFPNLSIVYDFLGNISYIERKYNKAKVYYQKANEINPNNFERKVILNKLNKRLRE